VIRTAIPTDVWPELRTGAAASTVVASIQVTRRDVASTGTSPVPSVIAISASLTVNRTRSPYRPTTRRRRGDAAATVRGPQPGRCVGLWTAGPSHGRCSRKPQVWLSIRDSGRSSFTRRSQQRPCDYRPLRQCDKRGFAAAPSRGLLLTVQDEHRVTGLRESGSAGYLALQ
jgi:hypothetical protein